MVRGQNIEWERKLEFIGSVIEPGAHSGGAVRHRTQKASSVFCKWKPLLCNPNLSLKERMKAFGASTLSSVTWLSGSGLCRNNKNKCRNPGAHVF